MSDEELQINIMINIIKTYKNEINEEVCNSTFYFFKLI